MRGNEVDGGGMEREGTKTRRKKKEREKGKNSHCYTKIARAREMDGERAYLSPTDVDDLDNAT